MIKTKKTSYPPIHMGTSLMLVIFVILCTILFSVLSLSNALKDWNYSEKNATRTLAYYEAHNHAEEILEHIDTALSEHSSYDACLSQLQTMDFLSLNHSDDSNNISATYIVPINDTESLEVVLLIHPENHIKYTILTWKQITTSDWDGNEALPVYGSH